MQVLASFVSFLPGSYTAADRNVVVTQFRMGHVLCFFSQSLSIALLWPSSVLQSPLVVGRAALPSAPTLRQLSPLAPADRPLVLPPAAELQSPAGRGLLVHRREQTAQLRSIRDDWEVLSTRDVSVCWSALAEPTVHT